PQDNLETAKSTQKQVVSISRTTNQELTNLSTRECDSEFTSMDSEEYNTSTLKEKSEDDIDQIALASAQTLLNNDENDDID
ncbi:3674_t:CDS:2, partial [Funneliformis caledonium]